MSEIVVQVTDVMKSFKVGIQDIAVLKGVSFTVNKGDFKLIIGPSGSGKSTLLHTVLGLEPPSSGKVNLLGTDIYSLSDEDDISEFRKKHIGMVYQQPNWIKALTVDENVAFPLILLGEDKVSALRKAWQALGNLNLGQWANYKPTELSGGQQQRVALARALVTNPEILIADEPTGNLDYQAGLDLMALMQNLVSQGRTIIMVTHDLEYIKYAKSAISILDGKVVGSYEGEELQELTKSVKTKRVEEIK